MSDGQSERTRSNSAVLLPGMVVRQKAEIPHPGEVLWGCRLFGGGCGVQYDCRCSPPRRFSVSRSDVCGCRGEMREKGKAGEVEI